MLTMIVKTVGDSSTTFDCLKKVYNPFVCHGPKWLEAFFPFKRQSSVPNYYRKHKYLKSKPLGMLRLEIVWAN